MIFSGANIWPKEVKGMTQTRLQDSRFSFCETTMLYTTFVNRIHGDQINCNNNASIEYIYKSTTVHRWWFLKYAYVSQNVGVFPQRGDDDRNQINKKMQLKPTPSQTLSWNMFPEFYPPYSHKPVLVGKSIYIHLLQTLTHVTSRINDSII